MRKHQSGLQKKSKINIRHHTEAPEFDVETAAKDQNIAETLTETDLTLTE